MKRGGVSGAVSLVMIFCVLCLAVFAVLTLATADREAKLTDMTAQNAADYYAADAAAVQIVSALRDGKTPETDIEIEHVFSEYPDGARETAAFTVPISDTQALEVEVLLADQNGPNFQITRWQTVYTGEWEPEEYMNLWDGF